MDGEFRNAAAPRGPYSAHLISPGHPPRPIGHADQNPPPRCFGIKPRRIISAFTGPGGQATDQPRTNPLTRTDIKIAPGALPGCLTITEGSQTALRTSLGNTLTTSEKRGEIR